VLDQLKNEYKSRRNRGKIDTMLYRVHLAMSGIQTHNIVAIGTDCICSCIEMLYIIETTTLYDMINVGHVSFILK
jgi:hypothetical protein